MKILLLSIGKTDSKALSELIDLYRARLGHYLSFELKCLPDVKRSGGMSQEMQREAEARALLSEFREGDQVVLLDERGEGMTSRQFSAYLEKQMLSGTKRLVFVIGGPYGFAEEAYKRANKLISLSQMTFSHQMIRLFVVEQLYRAMTILRGEPYHHD